MQQGIGSIFSKARTTDWHKEHVLVIALELVQKGYI